LTGAQSQILYHVKKWIKNHQYELKQDQSIKEAFTKDYR